VERRVKKLVLLVVVLGACRSAGVRPSGAQLSGAAAPRLAVEQLLAAIKATDLQAMSLIWGSGKGPARDLFERPELERREIIMQGCFDHDRYRILEEMAGTDGQRIFRVELTKGKTVATPRFWTVKGPSDRWYVQDLEMSAVTQICKQQ
jgi:hypothetical protein